MSLTVEMDGDL